jgi:ATP-binding cassette subfamily B protein
MNRILHILGLDLAGSTVAGLRPAVAWGFASAVFETLPYAVLVWVLHVAFTGTATAAHALVTAALLLACFAGVWFCKAQALLASFTATYGMVAAMRIAAADRLGRMSLGRVQKSRGATLADLFTDRFTLYQDIVTHIWWQLSSAIGFPILLWLLLAVAIFAPLAAVTVPWSFRLLDSATDRVIPARNDLANRVVELAEGIKDIQLMDVSRSRLAAAERSAADLETKSLETELAPSPAILSFSFIWSAAVAAAILFNIWAWQKGATGLVTLAASLILSARLCAALADLGVFLVEFRFARRALASIRDFVEQPLLPIPASPQMPRDTAISIDDVSFAHDDEQTLESISIDVPEGSMLALVGPSGSGKSTLAGLVARLWDVDGGAIRLGGVDVREMHPDMLNATVSMVLQDVSLFDMSVRDNIRLGRPDATDEAVIAAARAARIHERILEMPQGYDTFLDHGGIGLSGGERQRIAIARALVKDAPILILDEASSGVDLDNEWLIQEALQELTRGRTVLVVAHRLWTIAHADRIVVMDRGRVAEEGTHGQLLVQNGHYARLVAATNEHDFPRDISPAGE